MLGIDLVTLDLVDAADVAKLADLDRDRKLEVLVLRIDEIEAIRARR